MDTLSPETEEIVKSSFFRSHKVLYLIFLVFFIGIIGYYITSAPTNNRSRANHQPTIIHVAQGEPLSKVILNLENQRIIRYRLVLKVLLTVFKLDRQIEKGDYLFDKNMSAWSVAWMLARGDHHIDPIKITFKEGVTNNEMATILADKLMSFKKDLFLSDPKARQGYLFPDTYFFFPMTTADEIVDEMSANYIKRMSSIRKDIVGGKYEWEIITMASIIQKEAQGESDAPIVSGILWKRLRMNMPLQVDAAKETYSKAGLPLTAISNPGLIAIKAAFAPEDSPYLYYLHDKSGMIHLAETYTQHKANINKYLK